MKIARAMLHDVLVSQCGVDPDVLADYEGTCATLFSPYESRRARHPIVDLQRGLARSCPDIPWEWLHPAYTLDEISGFLELVISARMDHPAPLPQGVRWSHQAALSRETHAEDLVWQSGGCVMVLRGCGGQRTGDLAATMAWLGMLGGATSASTEPTERLHGRVRAMDQFLQRDHQLTKRAATVRLAAIEVLEHEVGIAHCGDTLIARVRHGRVERLSADHTLAADAFAAGVMDAPSEWAHMSTRGLGWPTRNACDYRVEPRRPGDHYVLVSQRPFGRNEPDDATLADESPERFTAWVAELDRRSANARWQLVRLDVYV